MVPSIHRLFRPVRPARWARPASVIRVWPTYRLAQPGQARQVRESVVGHGRPAQVQAGEPDQGTQVGESRTLNLGVGEIQHLQARHPSQVNESGIGDPRTVELKLHGAEVSDSGAPGRRRQPSCDSAIVTPGSRAPREMPGRRRRPAYSQVPAFGAWPGPSGGPAPHRSPACDSATESQGQSALRGEPARHP